MHAAELLYRVWTAYSTGWGLWVSVGMYGWLVVCLAVIARRSRLNLWWLAPVPVANFAMMCALGKRSRKCFWALTLPLAAIIIGLTIWLPLWTMAWLVIWAIAWVAAWMGIAAEMGKPAVLGLLILVPVANLVLVGALAFGE